MKYIVKPKNYSDACSFYFQLPFYTIKDLFKKSSLVFEENQIVFLSKYNNFTLLHYVRDDFEGYVTLKGIYSEEELKKFKCNNEFSVIKNLFIHMLRFLVSIVNPFTWNILLIVTITIIMFYLPSLLKLDSYIHGNELLNEACGIKCSNQLFFHWYVKFFEIVLSFSCSLLASFFCFYKFKNLKNSIQYDLVKLSAILFLSIHIMSLSRSINQMRSPKMVLTSRILWQKNYLDNKSKRAIASEVESLDIKN